MSSVTNVVVNRGIKKILMCDQKSRNSLSLAMMRNLLEHIKEGRENQDLRVIILAAQGPVFSAGHNLKELTSEAGRTKHEEVFRLASELMSSIIDSPVPVIAQRPLVCQLVAQCDIAVCTENSKFSTPGANFGIFCSTPGIPLARKVQGSTALHMLLTGLPITAAEAKASGLVSKVCTADDLEGEVQKISDAILSKSRSVIGLGKRFYYKQVDLDVRRAYDLGGEDGGESGHEGRQGGNQELRGEKEAGLVARGQ
ncbi:hypothetical protein NQ318_002804 [Aromia moschata]|uniref:Enoyl-CoA hydratase domain-containing protein 3, mitochondrial n=1 Tax=Aromia moschata TaxID=1265417 RepID=A0AAV8XTT8_9CUCU|nr:hypothetical protein NQ318_002804 [Aromia moschata]